MKKKILLIFVMAVAILCMLAFSVSASTNANSKVTLNSGAEVNLFDAEGNALIWYKNGDELKSIRADNAVYVSAAKVNNTTEFANYTSEGTVVVYGFCDGNTLERVKIIDNGVQIPASEMVVFNIMDNDITDGGLFDTNGTFNTVYEIHNATNGNGGTNLEYAYLGVNVLYLRENCFKGCKNLKYVNFEDLTELINIGTNGKESKVFDGCSSLFAGQTLDLSGNTKLKNIYGAQCFGGTGFIGIKLPNSIEVIHSNTFRGASIKSIVWPENIKGIDNEMFFGCTQLETIYLSSNVTSIRYNILSRANNLDTIFYCGTRDQFITLLSNIKINTWENNGNIYCLVENQWNPDGLWPVIGATKESDAKALHAALNEILGNANAEDIGNLISYDEYKKLEDKSGKYVVYDYSYCEAYNEGVHSLVNTNNCVATCNTCGDTVVYHNDDKNLLTTVIYSNYGEVGTKTIACQNDGCTYNVTEETPALFTCLGYSAPEDGRGGIAIGFTVNNEAIKEYTEATGKTLKYGVFAVLQSKLGDNDVFSEDGTVAEGVIDVEITKYEFAAFEIKIVGFTDEQKDTKLAMGAYVAVTDGETTKYSYMQDDSKGVKVGNYYFVSYNNIVGKPAVE